MVGGDGFDQACDGEGVADASFAADQMQPASLARKRDRELYQCRDTRTIDLWDFVQIDDDPARALGNEILHEGAKVFAGIADGQTTMDVDIVDTVGFA